MKTSIRKLTSQYLERTIFIFLVFKLQYLEPTRAVGRADQVGNETDHAALLAIRSQLTDPPAGIFSSWNVSLHHCYWQGVTCGRENNRVIALDISSSGLVGTISPFIGNLSFLQDIELNNNSLVGRIPPEIGRLLRLQELSIFSNMLDGELPTNLSACVQLQKIYLGGNKLEGELPLGLVALSKLKEISVPTNSFTGPLFKVIANLTSLEYINVAYNAFNGNIPASIGKMRNLSRLVIVKNELSGTIPTSILNCSMLIDISVGDNNLHGELPADIGLKLPHLVTFIFFSNQFSGGFPYSVLNLTGLEYLDLNTNNFVGRVPHDFRHFQNLKFLGLAINYLEGDINFVDSLVNCSNLKILELNGNEFTGILPESIANLSTSLLTFFLELKNIRGKLPAGITNLMSLQALAFRGNEITGFIPHDLGKLQNLQYLDFSSNRLEGIVPHTFENLSRLSELYLSDNQLEGIIPPGLGRCKSLLKLNLSSNHLNGTLADELFKGPAMFTIVDLSHNLLEGSIPLEISEQINLVDFYVSENKLSGVFPYGLGDCSALQTLDIHANDFHGNIPSSFSSLGSLKTVDFSRNNLSGTIPNYFSGFPLQMLNLSYNNFVGEVHTKGVFTNTSAIALDGNSKLCGGIPKLHLPRCMQSNKRRKGRSVSRTLKLIVPMLCALFVVVLVIMIWLYLTYSRKKRVPDSSHSLGETFMKVSYGMLFRATNGFSTENLIGSGSFGSVFRGNLDGVTIAVKVLNLLSRGASKSFMAECNALWNARHRNLVGIITTCSSIDFKRNDFKALVYEFMPNGSLDGWIHGNRAKKLTLLQRVDIAIDVAHALRYLHHDCEIPIVHCDLKPSNILLDSDMVAHVGDFGLAKFLAQTRHPNHSSTGIRGTIGYIAPEYGLGSEPSPHSDVYSYGILVLELMTGKRPTDNIFQEEFNLQIYAEGTLPDNVLHIVDPKLEGNEMTEDVHVIREIQATAHRRVECMRSVITVGISCSKHLPQDRMKIIDAISTLQVARVSLCNARQMV